MYLNEQVVADYISHQIAFSFVFDEEGLVLKTQGHFLDVGLLQHGSKITEILPENLIQRYYSFLSSEHDQFKVQLIINRNSETLFVNCIFSKLIGGEIELLGYISENNNKEASIPIDKLPYPIAIVKKDGEVMQMNNLFINYFIDRELIVRPLFIQKVIKTNELSPEKFDYLRMIESDANSRAVLCHYNRDKINQTFLLNLIPLSDEKPNLYLATVKDLTQFIEVQKNLEVQNEELKRQVQEEFDINKSYELKLLKKNRLESLGEIASGIFHELNQPLTHLSLKIDNMLEKYRKGDLNEDYLFVKTEQVQRQITRMRGIIDEMKQFSIVPDQRDELINVKEVLDCSLEDVSYLKVQGLVLIVKQLEDLKISGTGRELEQVFVNVLSNSLQALQLKMQKEKSFKPKLRIVFEKKEKLVRIVFIDNGLGASGDLKKLLKPFYTTKKNEGGTGLGLFIVNNLMRKMNGNIELKAREGRYFKTILTFPAIH